jgi:hypothetical protein
MGEVERHECKNMLFVAMNLVLAVRCVCLCCYANAVCCGLLFNSI